MQIVPAKKTLSSKTNAFEVCSATEAGKAAAVALGIEYVSVFFCAKSKLLAWSNADFKSSVPFSSKH